ncbi:MAG: hypothetical protein QF570_07750 [Myxococcota bacterium]|nr:hypothetical protein [Myxococcota bacterium]
MEQTTQSQRRPIRIAMLIALLCAAALGGAHLVSRADGPVFVFAGGPLTSGKMVELGDIDWSTLDAVHELEMEIVGTATSRTLWFSVHERIPYVACDLDCVDGELTRWPQQIERDDRVVLRIDAQRAEGRLTLVPHGTPEYEAVRAGRERKYSGEEGVYAATSAAAHGAVVEVGEVLTGRSKRPEPGDRLYRVDPR